MSASTAREIKLSDRVNRISVSSTMGAGVRVDQTSFTQPQA